MTTHTYGIDTRWVEGSVAAAGTKTYISSLVSALLELDRDNRYHLWGAPLLPTVPNVHNYPFRGYWRRGWQFAWKAFGWPRFDMVAPPADLWHFTNYVAPPTQKPFVVSVPDLSFVHFPQFTEPRNLRYLQRFVPDTLARAHRILAVSEATKEDLHTTFGVAHAKVTVTPLACRREYFSKAPPDELSRVRAKYRAPAEYVLTVGTLEPRKNLRSLLIAFAAMQRDTTEQLVVVGGPGWLFEETRELLRKLDLGGRVVLTGYVPQRDMPALYQGAKLFVFPSHYEGFGLPIVEAMASGTPVACSNASSLPEVGGTAVLYFDPEDTRTIRLTIERALGDDNLRRRLAEAGRLRAADFSWRRTAEQTLGVYRSVARHFQS